jgi:hypothetical protein
MKLKRYNDFLKISKEITEAMFIDKRGKLRSDADDEAGFNHSPRAERLLMFIEDNYKEEGFDKDWFKSFLIEKYDLELSTNDIYTELALAIRDQIIPESDLEEILSEIEVYANKN